jgi:hypothetical protein
MNGNDSHQNRQITKLLSRAKLAIESSSPPCVPRPKIWRLRKSKAQRAKLGMTWSELIIPAAEAEAARAA